MTNDRVTSVVLSQKGWSQTKIVIHLGWSHCTLQGTLSRNQVTGEYKDVLKISSERDDRMGHQQR